MHRGRYAAEHDTTNPPKVWFIDFFLFILDISFLRLPAADNFQCGRAVSGDISARPALSCRSGESTVLRSEG